MGDFKSRIPFNKRLEESRLIKGRYPERIPIICERASRNADVPLIAKCKFLAPAQMTIGQFMYVIRRNLSLPPEKALFLFVGTSLPTTQTLVRELYSDFVDEDGFLYIKYSGESVFGAVAPSGDGVLSGLGLCRRKLTCLAMYL